MNDIYVKKDVNGVIDYNGTRVCLVHHVIIFKDIGQGYNLVTMDKFYQNSDEAERDDIDNKLFEIFDNNDDFILRCDDESTFSCKFCSRPAKGAIERMSAESIGNSQF